MKNCGYFLLHTINDIFILQTNNLQANDFKPSCQNDYNEAIVGSLHTRVNVIYSKIVIYINIYCSHITMPFLKDINTLHIDSEVMRDIPGQSRPRNILRIF